MIYVVVAEEGKYSDYQCRLVKAFEDEGRARILADRLGRNVRACAIDPQYKRSAPPWGDEYRDEQQAYKRNRERVVRAHVEEDDPGFTCWSDAENVSYTVWTTELDRRPGNGITDEDRRVGRNDKEAALGR